MATIPNTTDSAAVAASLDQEFVKNFQEDADRLMEILGIFAPETIAAGTSLKMLKVTGELNDSKSDASKADGTGSGAVTLGSSSGAAYVEGDEVALSKFNASWEPVGEVTARPYRKLTTAAAILKSGYEASVLKTDQKMLSLIRAGIVSQFFGFLANGTGTATGKGLQACAVSADVSLLDAMENNNDSPDRIIHFMSRQDAGDYLASASITTQEAFGLTYLESFLGLENVFLTNKVAKGTLYATPVENLHLLAADFSALARADLAYATDAGGLIGVAHCPAYNRVSVETNVLTGATIFPEVKDYIVKGTITTK